jgi:hypothetical protein
MYNSYRRDVPQQPTANNNNHNHGRRRRKWPSSSASHEAFHPVSMHQISRGQPPKQADALFTGIGGGIPQDMAMATGTGTATATGMVTVTATTTTVKNNQLKVN